MKDTVAGYATAPYEGTREGVFGRESALLHPVTGEPFAVVKEWEEARGDHPTSWTAYGLPDGGISLTHGTPDFDQLETEVRRIAATLGVPRAD